MGPFLNSVQCFVLDAAVDLTLLPASIALEVAGVAGKGVLASAAVYVASTLVLAVVAAVDCLQMRNWLVLVAG